MGWPPFILYATINSMKKANTNLESLRHSCEHVLTQAMLNIWPEIKMAMGPAINDGFYFDFESKIKISEDDFPKIEAEMAKIIKANLRFKKEEITFKKARELFKDNPYKEEWLAEIKADNQKPIVYWTGDKFVDLCRGPHVKKTGEIKAFKLLSVAGAYWRGNEKNKMLTRIYGTAFPSKKELDVYIAGLEQAKKNDHRKLGRELDLFTFSDLVGSGFPLYTPKGAIIRLELNKYIEEIQSKEGYMQVWTPQVAKADLFKISGHYDKYKGDMFRVASNYSDEEFFLKPMNCPQHTQIFKSQARSYRDLPFRITDFAMLYRDEKPGELIGLSRVRSFSQDDCHVFCTEEQVDDEADRAITMIKKVMKTFSFSYRYRLSTRDPKRPKDYLGDPKIWDKTEKWAEEIMDRNEIEYFNAPGEAAFYAPKMDLMTTDALGREWQLSTLQIDYVMPQRFKLTYTDKKGKSRTPVMLHRAIIGSPERFIMIILEHFGGNLPIWLSPIQVKILPITEKHLAFAKKIFKQIKNQGVRIEVDEKNDTLQAKIRNAQTERIPYMIIVGDKEIKSGKISLRLRTGENKQVDTNSFINDTKRLISGRSLKI